MSTTPGQRPLPWDRARVSFATAKELREKVNAGFREITRDERLLYRPSGSLLRYTLEAKADLECLHEDSNKAQTKIEKAVFSKRSHPLVEPKPRGAMRWVPLKSKHGEQLTVFFTPDKVVARVLFGDQTALNRSTDPKLL